MIPSDASSLISEDCWNAVCIGNAAVYWSQRVGLLLSHKLVLALLCCGWLVVGDENMAPLAVLLLHTKQRNVPSKHRSYVANAGGAAGHSMGTLVVLYGFGQRTLARELGFMGSAKERCPLHHVASCQRLRFLCFTNSVCHRGSLCRHTPLHLTWTACQTP